MDLRLNGKIALVTGSTAGIGLAIAKSLVGEGARVYVNGRTPERVEKAIAEVRSHAPAASVDGIAADFATSAGAEAVIAKLPAVDVLVNNVGIFEPKPFSNIPDADWQRFFEINVMSGVRLSRRYLAGMLEKNWGRILFISSESAVQIPAEMVHYGMTKTAQVAIARGIAESVAGTGVTVNNGIASVHYSYTTQYGTYAANGPSLAGVPYTVTSHSLSSSSSTYYVFSPGAGGEGIGITSTSGTSVYAPAILVLPVDCYAEMTIYAPYTTTVTWKLLYANPTSNGTVASPGYGSYNSQTYQSNSAFNSANSCQTTSTTHSCAIGGYNFGAGTQLMLEENYGASSPISFTTAFSCRALSFTD